MRLLFILTIEFYMAVLALTSSHDNSTVIMPSFVMILDKNNGNLTKIVEKLDEFTKNSTKIHIEADACTELMTLDSASSEQIHFVFRQEFSNISFCEPHVFGPIPDVIEVRIPPVSNEEFSDNDDNFVTFQLTTKGGVIGFDVELNQPHAAANLHFAINSLLKISRMSPGYINGVDNFYRKRHMMPNEGQLARTRQQKYKQQIEKSYPIEYAMSLYILLLIIYAAAVAIWQLSGQRAERTAVASASNAAFSMAQNDLSIEITKTKETIEISEMAENQQANSIIDKSQKTQHSDKSESVMNIQSFSLKERSTVETCPIKSTRFIDSIPEAHTPLVIMTQETVGSNKE